MKSLYPFSQFIVLFLSCLSLSCTHITSVRHHVLRLKPQQEVFESLRQYLEEQHLEAAYVAAAVGSLTQVEWRKANAPGLSLSQGHFEVVSLQGTLSQHGGSHLHIAFSDENGQTWGGHLGKASYVYTTLEIVIVELLELQFTRKLDSSYGYHELCVEKKAP